MRNKQTGMAKSLTCILAMLGVILTPILASAVTIITFDTLTGMTNTPGGGVLGPSQLSTQLHASTGAVFSSDLPYVAVVDLGFGHAISSAINAEGEIYNGIGGVSDGGPLGGNLSYGTPIFVTFFNPTNALEKFVTDYVEIRGDQINTTLGLGTATMEAFDINGLSILALGINPDTEFDTNGGLTLSISFPGIHSVRISESIPSIAFDDLKFNTPTAAPLPEPASLMLLGAGLAGIGIWRRKVAKSEKGV